ncbi:MAG: 16S rRNA (uracil(1498)-N(3))-methyltransferase [Streptosporangiaceae bacterium]
MSAPIFLADRAQLLGRDQVTLGGREGRHAATVRRVRPGERVDLTDGEGLVAECVVDNSGRDVLELSVRARREVPEPAPRLVVVQALPRADRGELAVETMTEVGVDGVVPWAAARSVTRWHGARGTRGLDRWRARAREAAKQSRRSWVPRVYELVTIETVERLLRDAVLAVVLDTGADRPLSSLLPPSGGDVVTVVGPEGGFAPEERSAFEAVGVRWAHLGPTILRTSTAGAVAAALLLSRTRRW